MIRPRTAALVLALAVPIAGCGGDDDAERFAERYNAAIEKLSKVDSEIGQATRDVGRRSYAAIGREFEGIADTAEQTRSDLAALDPPEDAKDEFDSLLSAMRKGVANLEAVADAAKRKDPRTYNRAVRALSRAGEEITAAEDALKKAVEG